MRFYKRDCCPKQRLSKDIELWVGRSFGHLGWFGGWTAFAQADGDFAMFFDLAHDLLGALDISGREFGIKLGLLLGIRI